MSAPPIEWAANEQELAEIARRRRVLGLGPGQVLSDEQVLQIADPGPEPKSRTQQRRNKGTRNKTAVTAKVHGTAVTATLQVSEEAMSLVMAVSAGNAPQVQELITSGAHVHVNQRFKDSTNMLMHAMKLPDSYGGQEIICGCMQPLLAHGADVNYLDNKGQTALHHAFAKQLHQVADLLLAHGAIATRCRGGSGGKCEKCRLFSRRRKQQPQAVVVPKASVDTFEQVLQDEFGDCGDFAQELARAKAEDAAAAAASTSSSSSGGGGGSGQRNLVEPSSSNRQQAASALATNNKPQTTAQRNRLKKKRQERARKLRKEQEKLDLVREQEQGVHPLALPALLP